MTTEELLEECLEAFDALASPSPSGFAKHVLKKRGTPHKKFKGTSASQLARMMASLIREHLGRSN